MKKLFVVDLDDTLCNTERDMKGDVTRLPFLTLAPGAREFLEEYGKETVLLSAGIDELQRKKLDILEIYNYFHSVVIVSLPEEKAPALKKILVESGVSPQSAVLIGDRIDQEIKAGNQLGVTTVRMWLEGGKYHELSPSNPEETPTYTVLNFDELRGLPFF